MSEDEQLINSQADARPDQAQPVADSNVTESSESSTEEELDTTVTEEEDDSTDSPAVQGQLKKLRDKLKQCEQQKQEYLTGWQRAKADFINTQKNWESKRADLESQTQAEMIQDLLPVLDSFEMAWTDSEAWEAIDKNWRTGVEQIFAQLWEVFKKHGVEEIKPVVGDVFKPEVHEALSTVETEAKGDGTVQEVIQKGYQLPDRVIRTAKVKVGQIRSV